MNRTFAAAGLALAAFGSTSSAVDENTFLAPRTLLDAPPAEVLTADLGNDGVVDLVTVTDGSDVIVLSGLGDGRFGAARTYGTDGPASGAILVDVVGNTAVDIVVPHTFQDRIVVLEGLGGGTFAPPALLLTTPKPRQIAALEIDGDGNLDLVVTSKLESRIRSFLGDSIGGFTEVSSGPTGTAPDVMVVGHVDDDGQPDVVVTNAGLNTAGILIGRPNGVFVPAGVVPTGDGPKDVVLADLDADGDTDLAIQHEDGLTIATWEDPGVFVVTEVAVTGAPSGLVAAQVDDDEIVDLFVVDEDGGLVTWIALEGKGTFDTVQRIATAAAGISDVIAADFDGDGDVDLLSADAPGSTIALTRGHGDGTFGPADTIATVAGPYWMDAGDLDEDGLLDIVVGSVSDLTLYAVLALDASSFAEPSSLGIPAGEVELFDLDDDGHLDLLSSSKLHLGNGDGSFMESTSFAPLGGPQVVHDVDGDGVPDVAGPSGSGGLFVHPGNGDGTFQVGTLVAPETGFRDLLVADVDGNGRPDVCALATGMSDVHVFEVSGGTLVLAARYPVGDIGPFAGFAILGGLSAADTDDDGDLDPATTSGVVARRR